ncbi:MAG TPA: hypothetical protein VF160_06835 [Candidatus Dormibacteraeota bacterium]
MGPELALGLPAVGAVLAAALRRRPAVALAGGGLLGLAGAVVLALLAVPQAQSSLLGLNLPAAPRALLLLTALALAVMVALAPPQADRVGLLAAGLAGMAGLAAVAAAPDVLAVAVVVAVLAAGHAALPGGQPFPTRMRAPGLAVALLLAGALLQHAGDAPVFARLAALSLVLSLVAAAGLVPFLPELDPEEPAPASPVAWTGFFGPALAIALVARMQPTIGADGVPVYGSLLVGLGVLNLAWGTVGAWRADGDVAAWRYSFLADWGLALVGLGMVVPDGYAAAYLVLASVLLVRFPLYLWARPVLLNRAPAAMGPANVLLAAALAGAAPFAGFSVRVLLLRAATQVYWPLALVLGLGMLIWLAHSFRLARTLGAPAGRSAVGVVLALGFSLLLGLAPAVLLALGGL